MEQKNQLNQLQNQKKELVNQIADTENDIKVRTLSAESIAHAAFQNKCAELDIKFNKIEADYANKIIEVSNNIITYDLIKEIENKTSDN